MFAHLRYRLRKILVGGVELVQFPGEVGHDVSLIPILGGPRKTMVEYYMILPNVWELQVKTLDVTEVWYQVEQTKLHFFSPIYKHPFKANPTTVKGSAWRMCIGPMRLHPAEEVWPELTRKGYYGELPQFYT